MDTALPSHYYNIKNEICSIPLIFLLLLINSCDFSVDRNDEDNLLAYRQSNSYSGNMLVTIDSTSTSLDFSININSEDPFMGSFFSKNDGTVWSYTGLKTGNYADINGSITGYYTGAFEGGFKFASANKIAINLKGVSSLGEFTAEGNFDKIAAISLIGKYDIWEEGSITLSYGGESETQFIEGGAQLELCQSEDGTYNIGNTITSRSGRVIGNKLILTGQFVVPNGEIIIDKDEFKAEVKIDDQYNFTFNGEGHSEGTYQGEKFVCVGSTKGTFKRKFDAAIALLAGNVGLSGLIGRGDAAYLETMEKFSISENEHNIITNKFPAAWWIPNLTTQEQNVKSWLNYIYSNFGNSTKIILIGHSAGGDAVCMGNYQEFIIESRITLDPFDPFGNDVKFLGYNQGSVTRTATPPITRFMNLLSVLKTTDGIEFHGYHIKDALNMMKEYQIKDANHRDIIINRTALNYILGEVNSIAPYVSLPTTYNVSRKLAKTNKIILINSSLLINEFSFGSSKK